MFNRACLISASALFLLLASPVGCGGEGSSTTPATTKDGAPDRGSRTGDKTEEEGPAEPIPFDVAPLTGETKLSVGMKVTDSAGDEVKLKKLLRDPSVLFYTGSNHKDKGTRAATRIGLRPLARSAAPAGFRIVVLFEKGTSTADAERFLEKRRIPDTVYWAVDHEGDFAEANKWELRTAALTDSNGTVGVLFEPTDEWDTRVGTAPVLTSDILARAWQMPDVGPDIDDATMQAGVDAIQATVAGADANVTAAGLGDKIEHPVWVSLFRPGSTSRLRGVAVDGKLGPALVAATQDALESAGDKKADWLADAAELRIQVDMTGATGPIVTTGKRALWYIVEPGVHGVVVRTAEQDGIVLPSEPVTQGWMSPRVRNREKKHPKMFDVACKRAGLKKGCWKTDEVELMRFRSSSFGAVEGGGEAVALFRGNVLWEGDATEEQLLYSIKVGGLWLVNTVQDDGKFDYEYYPNKDEGSRGYNIVRHAGSVYGLFEMWELAGHEAALSEDRDRYIAAAAGSIGYVYEGIKAPDKARAPDRRCLLDDRGRCDSGSAALTLLTLLVRPDPEEVPAEHRAAIYRDDETEIMEGLGLTLLDMIDDKGQVWRKYSEAMTQEEVKKEPLYYPGESMLALVRFHEATGDERWLDGARRIAERQMGWYERERFNNPDHWVMQALYRLWLIDKDDRYATNLYAMGRHYASEQYGVDGHLGPIWSPWPDYIGAYRRTNDTPRTTRAGSRSEALRAATELAWARGDDATPYEEALLGAARHLMEQQYTERNGYWIPDLARVHGAYPMGVVDNHVRIDNNQHALVGMVGALNAHRRRAAAQ